MAEVLIERDWPEVDPSEVEAITREVVAYVADRFDVAKGRPGLTEEGRFLAFFRTHLRRKLRSARRDEVSRERPNATRRYAETKRARDLVEEEAESWRRHVYHEALAGLEEEAFIRHHLRDGLSMERTAAAMGRSRSYLRRYNEERLVPVLRSRVSEWATGLPREEFESLLDRLDLSGLFDVAEMAQLLAVDEDVVRAGLRGRAA
jgi:hypothetical protein